MNNLEKMEKEELKSLFINHLEKIADLVKWSNENGAAVLFGDLLLESSYIKNIFLKNPYNDMHKHMEKKHYLNEIQGYEELINKLEDLKDKHEKGHFNQSKKSDLNQTNRENENNNSDQKYEDNTLEKEKSNLIQNKRGGKREGAGRKAIGETRKVSLTLPNELWSEIEFLCDYDGESQSKVIRKMLEKQMPNTKMIQDIKEFQNANIGADITSNEDAVDFCVKLVHEIFIQKKHKYEPDLK